MKRHIIEPRTDWQTIVEGQGLHYHTDDDGNPYWNESAYYEFTSQEIDLIEQATYACNDMCLQAIQHIIDTNLWDKFLIPENWRDAIVASWEQDEHTIYGRFDFSIQDGGNPMMLEYNADTPTALLEAAVVQWFWLKDRFPNSDQFNTIHERLLEVWKTLKSETNERYYFSAVKGHVEDYMTVQYMRDIAIQAGFGPVEGSEYINVEDIGWNGTNFTNLQERPIRNIFKLYPWEWLMREPFGQHILTADTNWMEPLWKILLSTKAILPVLWELFPKSPYLLKSYFSEEEFRIYSGSQSYVRKPMLAREGANVSIVSFGDKLAETDGPYDGKTLAVPANSIYQELWELPSFDDHHAVIGSWMVNGWACGIGIREDSGLVTGNTSRFVPHIFGKKKKYG